MMLKSFISFPPLAKFLPRSKDRARQNILKI
jgi:hypothetical protein